MPEKININDSLGKRDLETILEVNRKAIEIQTEVAGQNEEIIDCLTDIQKAQDSDSKKIDKLVIAADATNKDLFRIQVLFVTGLLSLVIQVIQIFLKQ